MKFQPYFDFNPSPITICILVFILLKLYINHARVRSSSIYSVGYTYLIAIPILPKVIIDPMNYFSTLQFGKVRIIYAVKIDI